MTDREMLEAAARAIGIEKPHYENGSWLELRYGYKIAMWHDDFDSYWNPLESNADAFALAVKLGINLEIGEPGFGDVQAGKKDHWACEWLNPDKPCASARRAITRAAAEIGRTM